MTRQEFIDNTDFWYELIDFCNEEECDICEDIVDGDDLEDRIRDDFSNYGSDYPWTDIRRWLNDIVEGHAYYVCNGSFEYEYLDGEDFERYKEDVLNWMDENGIWDEEDDDWNDEESTTEDLIQDDEEDEDVPEEDISISDLLNMCSGMLKTIKEDEQKTAREEEEQLARFVCHRK